MEENKKFTKAGLLPTIALAGAAILGSPAVDVEITDVDGTTMTIGSVAHAGVGVGGGGKSGGSSGGKSGGSRGGFSSHGGGGSRKTDACDYRTVGAGAQADVVVAGLEKTNPVFLNKLKQDNLWQTQFNQHDVDGNVTGKILVVYNDKSCEFETLSRYNQRILNKISNAKKETVQPLIHKTYTITVNAPERTAPVIEVPANVPAIKETPKPAVVKPVPPKSAVKKPATKKQDKIEFGGMSTDAQTIANSNKALILAGQNGEVINTTCDGFINRYGDALYKLLIAGGFILIAGIAYRLFSKGEKEQNETEPEYTGNRAERRHAKKAVRQEVKREALYANPEKFVSQDGNEISNLNVGDRNFW